MCGITGIYAFNMIGRMNMINMAASTEKLAHRGPDFQNGYADERVGLGHRRLSVIDTTPAGHQPMCDSTERYWLVFNGEVYNFVELKTELMEKGVSFMSESDTEVVLQLLIQEGEAALNRFNGFFSLAFYDREQGELLIALDRFGIKPLYYFFDQDKFLFSSEMPSLLQYGLEKEIDYNALLFYLQLNYVPAPMTMMKGVNKLFPGHLIKVRHGEMDIQKWYTPTISESKLGYTEAQKQLVEHLERAVEQRLVSDVPLGAFLSGGLDSSIISTLAINQKPDLNTFSVCFSEEKYFDESDYSDLVAKKMGSSHHRFDLTRRTFEDHWESIMNSFGEPFADSSAIAYNLLSRETRGFSTVALSGDGADELFGGYNKHSAYMRMLSNPLLTAGAMGISPFLYLLPASRSSALGNKVRQMRKYANASSKSDKEKYWYLAALTSEKSAMRWIQPSLREKIERERYNLDKSNYLNPMNTKGLNSFLQADQQLVLPWDMLTKADRMSMAHGLEVRVPFLDHKLVSFANNLPADYKIHGKQRKRILYDAFRDQLPAELYHRPKRGFEVPLLSWLNNSSIKYELGKLTDEHYLKEQGIFDPKQIKKLVKSLKSSSPTDSHARVWAILVFQWWYRRVFG